MKPESDQDWEALCANIPRWKKLARDQVAQLPDCYEIPPAMPRRKVAQGLHAAKSRAESELQALKDYRRLMQQRRMT
jgi:hypothetical protein